jgi:hypothetical protein
MDYKLVAAGIEALQDMRSIINEKSFGLWIKDDVKYGVYKEVYNLINLEIEKRINEITS